MLEGNRIRWYETLISFFDKNLAARKAVDAIGGAEAATAIP